MRRYVAIAAVSFVALVAGCGDQGIERQCTRACPAEQTCQIAPDCNDVVECGYSQVCVASCENDADCPSGHVCDGGNCSVFCESCPRGQTCSTRLGVCVGAACTEETCPSGSFCDVAQDACFPRSGSCEDQACRRVPAGNRGALTIACGDDGWCHAEPRSVPRPDDLDAYVTVGVLAPRAAQVLPEGELSFRWRRRKNAVILLVTTEPPTSMAVLSRSAIWGDARDAEVTETTWQHGVEVGKNGAWGGKPKPPPLGIPLYLLVQEVNEGELLGTSETIPFAVGEPAWLEEGDTCRDEGQAPGDCLHPIEPRVCHESACRRLCESDADCGEMRCGLPDPGSGLRACGVN
jgi:hypothetical protein